MNLWKAWRNRKQIEAEYERAQQAARDGKSHVRLFSSALKAAKKDGLTREELTNLVGVLWDTWTVGVEPAVETIQDAVRRVRELAD